MLIKLKLPEKLERGNGHDKRCKCTVCFHSYGYAQALDEISTMNQPLVRGIVIDIETFAKEMFEMCTFPEPTPWEELDQKTQDRWKANALVLSKRANVWLKEVEKGK